MKGQTDSWPEGQATAVATTSDNGPISTLADFKRGNHGLGARVCRDRLRVCRHWCWRFQRVA